MACGRAWDKGSDFFSPCSLDDLCLTAHDPVVSPALQIHEHIFSRCFVFVLVDLHHNRWRFCSRISVIHGGRLKLGPEHSPNKSQVLHLISNGGTWHPMWHFGHCVSFVIVLLMFRFCVYERLLRTPRVDHHVHTALGGSRLSCILHQIGICRYYCVLRLVDAAPGVTGFRT
jgi:hypothetical protein